jgi:pimeloyl-ACP methyl ester carboxylesterase
MLKSLPEPDLRIRYAKSFDGVNLAYWTAGDGDPLIFLPSLVTNVEADWRTDRGRAYACLAENHLLVRYDGRGHGMSDRRPPQLSLDALVRDLEAIADELELPRFAIFAPSIAATTAIAFAAKHPERVSRLVLFQPFPSFAEYFGSSIKDALPLLYGNWDVFTMTVAHIRLGWLRPDQARRSAALLRESVDQEFYIREVEQAAEISARPLMSDVRTPTLIICRRDFGEYEIQTARTIAAAIPTATLELVDGSNNGIWDERQQALRETERFLGVERFVAEPVPALPEYLHNRSHDLSRREVDVLRYLANGQRNKEIAADLGLSVYTVARHVATIYAKIGAHGRAEATRYALEHGILEPREAAALR